MSESVLTKKNVALVQIINRPQMSIWLATLASVALIYLASPAMDGSGDPDYYWHMLYARWILEHGAIPKADFISWPFSGQTYLLTQWLGQVLIGLADKAGGGQGRALLTLAAVMSTVCMSWAIAKQRCADTTNGVSHRYGGVSYVLVHICPASDVQLCGDDDADLGRRGVT